MICDTSAVCKWLLLLPKTGCMWFRFRECDNLLYWEMCPIRLKLAVYKSFVRPASLYRSEAWCLKESVIGILVRAMCGVQLKD